MSQQRDWQLSHIAAGLCHLCSRPLHPDSKSMCYHHLLKKRIYNRNKQGCRPKRPGKQGRPAITRTPQPSELSK